MHESPEAVVIFVAGALLAAGLAASLLAGRLRVPGLVLFLGVGMAVGSDGTGWIEFNDYELARTIGVIALALILFEGGLAVDFRELRPIIPAAVSLAVVGTVLTATITGLGAALLFDFSVKEGALVGAILAATDGAAVFSVLRGSPLRRRLAHTLEAESGFNDPVAVVLVLAGIEWITDPAYGVADLLELVVRQFGLGLVVGVLVGRLAVQGFRRAGLASSGLYPVASLAVAALSYGGAAVLDGSGFLAVYIAGLTLSSAVIPAKRTIRIFHEGLGWIAQLSMFVALGLLVFPSQLDDVALKGTALALILVFVSRPVATIVALTPLRIGVAEQATLGWAGLRGAVPVVLATFPVLEHVPRSLELFNIVFFAVVLSTILQGSTFEAVARRLGVTETGRRTVGRGLIPGREMIFTARPWPRDGGDPAYPREVLGVRVIEVLNVRRDSSGSLVVLEDGRYALCGAVVAVGSRDDVIDWARRRLKTVPEEERAWLQRGIGWLAADV